MFMGNDEKIITPGQGLIRLLLIIFRISSFTNRWNKYLKLKIEIGSLFMLFCTRLAFRQADKHNFHIITQVNEVIDILKKFQFIL